MAWRCWCRVRLDFGTISLRLGLVFGQGWRYDCPSCRFCSSASSASKGHGNGSSSFFWMRGPVSFGCNRWRSWSLRMAQRIGRGWKSILKTHKLVVMAVETAAVCCARNFITRIKSVISLTLWRNWLKLLFTIALTTLPLTSANQILIKVLTMRRASKEYMYVASLQVHEGIAYPISTLTLFMNSSSTLPLPFLFFASYMPTITQVRPWALDGFLNFVHLLFLQHLYPLCYQRLYSWSLWCQWEGWLWLLPEPSKITSRKLDWIYLIIGMSHLGHLFPLNRWLWWSKNRLPSWGESQQVSGDSLLGWQAWMFTRPGYPP